MTEPESSAGDANVVQILQSEYHRLMEMNADLQNENSKLRKKAAGPLEQRQEYDPSDRGYEMMFESKNQEIADLKESLDFWKRMNAQAEERVRELEGKEWAINQAIKVTPNVPMSQIISAATKLMMFMKEP